MQYAIRYGDLYCTTLKEILVYWEVSVSFLRKKKKKRRDESSSSSVTHISLKISIAQKLQNSFKLQKQQAKAHAYHCQHNIPQIYLTMDSLSSHAKLQFVE